MHHPGASGVKDTLLSRLRRIAKMIKADNPPWQLAQAQNLVAVRLGFKNWSLLHKFLASASPLLVESVEGAAKKDIVLASYLERMAPLDLEAARDEMEEWVRSNLSPLINFAFYDNESENGFAWQDEDLSNELQQEFSEKYPLELIEKVALDLEMSEGPWGYEDYGSDSD
jgi:hypothetical protein